MKMKQTQYDVLKTYVTRYLNQVDYPAKQPDQNESDFNWQLYQGTIVHFEIEWMNILLCSYMTKCEVIDVVQQIVYNYTKDLVVHQPSYSPIDVKITIESRAGVGKSTIAYTIQRALQQLGINSVHVHDDNGVNVVDATPQQIREHLDEKINTIVSNQPIIEICTKQLRNKPPAEHTCVFEYNRLRENICRETSAE